MSTGRNRGLVFLVPLTFLLAACGSAEGDNSDRAKIVMLSHPAGDTFYYSVEQGARAEAERLGVDLEVQRISAVSAEAQIPILNAVIAKNPDAILIGPADSNALQEPLEEAADRGIKIVLYDTTVVDPSFAVTFVSADIEEQGRLAGEVLLDATGGKGTVYYEGHLVGQHYFDSLRSGWTEAMDTAPDVKQLEVVYSGFDTAKAESNVRTLLAGNPELAGGFMGVEVGVIGGLEAFRRAGRTDVALVAADGAPAIVEAVRAGQVLATVNSHAGEIGTKALSSAVDALAGKTVPPTQFVENCVLTTENIDTPEMAPCINEAEE